MCTGCGNGRRGASCAESAVSEDGLLPPEAASESSSLSSDMRIGCDASQPGQALPLMMTTDEPPPAESLLSADRSLLLAGAAAAGHGACAAVGVSGAAGTARGTAAVFLRLAAGVAAADAFRFCLRAGGPAIAAAADGCSVASDRMPVRALCMALLPWGAAC